MYLRTVLILAVLGVLVIFVAINWSAFTVPTALSMLFATVEAPLGLILLGIVALLTALFLVYVLYLQSSVLMENRRHARDLQAQRELAEQAEVSRFNQLRYFLEDELRKLTDKNEASRAGIIARLDQLDRELRAAVEQSGNALAAYIGEIEDRLERTASNQTAR
jgi:uncharacterized integral membrane protein